MPVAPARTVASSGAEFDMNKDAMNRHLTFDHFDQLRQGGLALLRVFLVPQQILNAVHQLATSGCQRVDIRPGCRRHLIASGVKNVKGSGNATFGTGRRTGREHGHPVGRQIIIVNYMLAALVVANNRSGARVYQIGLIKFIKLLYQ